MTLSNIIHTFLPGNPENNIIKDVNITQLITGIRYYLPRGFQQIGLDIDINGNRYLVFERIPINFELTFWMYHRCTRFNLVGLRICHTNYGMTYLEGPAICMGAPHYLNGSSYCIGPAQKNGRHLMHTYVVNPKYTPSLRFTDKANNPIRFASNAYNTYDENVQRLSFYLFTFDLFLQF